MTSKAESAESTSSRPTSGKAGTLQSIAVFFERRVFVMLLLGFSAGLPGLLVFDTLQLWLREAGLSLTAIGIFSLATLATAMKFLWAPVVDRTSVPFLTALLGHRRSWMLVSQAAIILGLWLISGTNPATHLGLMALFAVLVSFAAANQDVVIDAWRIEAAEDERQGAMAAAYQWGYRVAMITAGAAPLFLAQSYGWSLSYAVMAALMAIGVGAVLMAPREVAHVVRAIATTGLEAKPALEIVEWIARSLILTTGGLLVGSGLAGSADFLAAIFNVFGAKGAADAALALWSGEAKVFVQLAAVVLGFGVIVLAAWPVPGVPTRPGIYLSSALGQPLVDFFGRYGKLAGLILALICLYRVSDFVLNINSAFYSDLGFSKVQIAEVRKLFGVVISILGVTLGGFAVMRLGLMRAMIIGAFLGPLSNLAFAWLAFQGHSMPALYIAIGIDNIAGGFAGTALIAYMSSLTAEGFTATQYALFSSLYALPGKILASQSGRIVEGIAKSTDAGGVFAVFKGLMTGLTPESYAQAMSKSGVSPAALGVGYLTFYLYSTLIGVVAIVLVFMVVARQQPNATPAEAVES